MCGSVSYSRLACSAVDAFLGISAEGNRLASAKIGPAFKRATALKALRALDTRVENLMADPRRGIGVEAVILFGSMTDSTRDPAGDVDFAIELALVDPRQVTLDGVFSAYRFLQGRSKCVSIVELGPHRKMVENGPHLALWRGGSRVFDVTELG